MRRTTWLILVCLISLGVMVAIKIGTAKPEGADADEARVGSAVERALSNKLRKLSRLEAPRLMG
jgi:hypothetical protein